MKKKLSLAMGILLVLAWYVTISTWFGNEDKYEGHIAEAQRLEKKGLYLDAISEYGRAKELKPDALEIEEYIADDYLAMGDHKEYKRQLNDIIDQYGPVEKDVKKLCEFYKEYSSENNLISCINNLYERFPDNATVKAYYNSVKGVYSEKFVSLDKIENFHGDYAAFALNGKKGLMDSEGEIVIEAVYDDILYNGKDMDTITVRDGKKYFFINDSGYKTEEPPEQYQYLGPVYQKRIAAQKNGKYGYLDGMLKEKIPFLYDDATSFHDGIAAVKKGDKWALINRKGENVTECIFEDVAVNSNGFCSVNDRICVEQNGKWFLINTEGETVGTDTYQDMKAFEGEEFCAVCKNGKWGFIDSDGALIINCEYQDAKSFVNGFAPVRQDNLWGYIDPENNMVIEYAFEDAGNMTEHGVAPVSHGGSWTLIELKIMN